MSADPHLDHAALRALVGSAFGLAVEELTFLPEGTSHAYRAQGPEGRFFLKVQPDSPYGARATARARREAPLLQALREEGLTHVPRPLPTRAGGWSAALGGFQVFAYDWIDAVNLGQDWTAALPELAPLLGRVHGCAARIGAQGLALPVPPEDFALPFDALLTGALHTLAHLPADARPALVRLAGLLGPHLPLIQALLTQAREAARQARQDPPPFVPCHTDAHGGNVMRARDSALWLIDWETARLAPPEHDLWMLGRHLPALLPAYAGGRGQPYEPRSHLLRFYVLRRSLEDLAEDLRWLLHERPTPQTEAHSLDLIERFMLPALLSAEADVAALEG
ncbi:phosphotransferase [Deinococcus aquaedulcis]|uniref:phosphotransferase n=1 Tax=Deinococcus aquaedulcis TaxID=2840455 RepID=UPI001C83D832|nr:aminoglycoside phosphotransferase family protein [Deinococcus aquaedulcis]